MYFWWAIKNIQKVIAENQEEEWTQVAVGDKFTIDMVFLDSFLSILKIAADPGREILI